MNFILPIILIVTSIGSFFFYTDRINRGPWEKQTSPGITEDVAYQTLKKNTTELDQALARSEDIIKVRDNLKTKYNSFTEEELERASVLLPDNIDNIRLIIDIDAMAKKYNLVARNIAVEDPKDGQDKAASTAATRQLGSLGAGSSKYGVRSVRFSVLAPYDSLLQFLRDLEDSLRLLDVTSVSFTSADSGLYDVTVNLKTYWLK